MGIPAKRVAGGGVSSWDEESVASEGKRGGSRRWTRMNTDLGSGVK